MTKEVPKLTLQGIKEPVCEVVGDPSENYFLDKLTSVDSENWDEMTNLMHFHSGLYDITNYDEIGAKISKYLETVSY